MSLPFLDTNIFLRHLLYDVPNQAASATSYLTRIERGEVTVRTSDIVVFETVFTLQRTHRKGRAEIRDTLLPILELPGIVLPGKRRYRRVFDLFVDRNLGFADAYHVVLMESLGLTQIVSFDQDFDKVPGLERLTP